MNDQQSDEMIKQLRRIADSLEGLSPPQPKETLNMGDVLKGRGYPVDPDLQKQIEEYIRSKAETFSQKHSDEKK